MELLWQPKFSFCHKCACSWCTAASTCFSRVQPCIIISMAVFVLPEHQLPSSAFLPTCSRIPGLISLVQPTLSRQPLSSSADSEPYVLFERQNPLVLCATLSSKQARACRTRHGDNGKRSNNTIVLRCLRLALRRLVSFASCCRRKCRLKRSRCVQDEKRQIHFWSI